MEKLLDRFHKIHGSGGIINGLLAAQAICTKHMLVANSHDKVDAISAIMQDICELMDKAYQKTL